MRQALETLPWVEKGSIEVNVKQGLASLKVQESEQFQLDEVQKALPARYKASLAKAGSAVTTEGG